MHCAIGFVKSATEVYEGVTGGAWRQDRGVIHFVALWLVNMFVHSRASYFAPSPPPRQFCIFVAYNLSSRKCARGGVE